MNLPFTPTFFRKIDVYQRIMEFENDLSIKHIWQAEKVILIWSAGEHHQHIGSYIDAKCAMVPLRQAVNDGLLDQDSVEYAVSPQHVLNSLITKGFAEKNPTNESVKITQDGFWAGKILKETDRLKKVSTYQFWIWFWWLVFVLALIILFYQAWPGLISVIHFIIKILQGIHF